MRAHRENRERIRSRTVWPAHRQRLSPILFALLASLVVVISGGVSFATQSRPQALSQVKGLGSPQSGPEPISATREADATVPVLASHPAAGTTELLHPGALHPGINNKAVCVSISNVQVVIGTSGTTATIYWVVYPSTAAMNFSWSPNPPGGSGWKYVNPGSGSVGISGIVAGSVVYYQIVATGSCSSPYNQFVYSSSFFTTTAGGTGGKTGGGTC